MNNFTANASESFADKISSLSKLPEIAEFSDQTVRLTLNWIFTCGILLGNLSVVILTLGSRSLWKSSKYTLAAMLAVADLLDGGCLLPMWTDVLMNRQLQFSCRFRYLMSALGYSVCCVCSLLVVALNTDFNFRRGCAWYRGRIKFLVMFIILLVCWLGPVVALGPIVAHGMTSFNQPVHCFFTLDKNTDVFFLLAFFIPAGAIVVSTGFVIFVHYKTKTCQETPLPFDIIGFACLTLCFYLPFGFALRSSYDCRPKECYRAFVSRFLDIGNLLYAKSAIFPWLWFFTRGFREEVKDMFLVRDQAYG